jgi:hypothetical protein
MARKKELCPMLILYYEDEVKGLSKTRSIIFYECLVKEESMTENVAFGQNRKNRLTSSGCRIAKIKKDFTFLFFYFFFTILLF